MLLKKQGFPEEGEFVLCTVTKIYHNSIFANLDEYQKSGMIHISEISPGRIRNIRDYVVEGKKIVCKILRVNKEKGYIDLSLRRVNENQRRNKINDTKKEQIAEKIITTVAKQTKQDPIKLSKDIYEKIKEKYIGIYGFFESAIKDKNVLDELKLQTEITEVLATNIQERIKPKEFKVKKVFMMQTYAPDGVELIKDILKKIDESGIKVVYEGGGRYRMELVSDSYKDAEKKIHEKEEMIEKVMEKNEGVFELLEK